MLIASISLSPVRVSLFTADFHAEKVVGGSKSLLNSVNILDRNAIMKVSSK